MSATFFDTSDGSAVQRTAAGPRAEPELAALGGNVVHYDNLPERPPDEHEYATLLHLASRLAHVLGYRYLGAYDRRRRGPGHVYFVPRDTLTAAEARDLGICDHNDLFGGVVPHSVLRTKAITHPLYDAAAECPDGWSRKFPQQVASVVLPGHTAFSKADARRAGVALLRNGAVRFKLGSGVGGSGQTVIREVRALDASLDELSDAELADFGLVVETNLDAAVTYGVGQVRLASHRISYCGLQRRTVNNHGEEVYGGSDLHVVPGDFADLLRLDLPADTRLAIRQACCFDAAVSTAFPNFTVSRNNYDIVQGRDGTGSLRSGVLEQSWRIGGASPAEVAAIEAFDANPGLRSVRASAIERYGAYEPPPHARIYYSGVDARIGQLVKFTVVESDEHAARVIHHSGRE